MYTLSNGDGESLSILSDRYRSKATHTYTQSQFDEFAKHPSTLALKSSRQELSQKRLVPLVLRYHPLFSWVARQTILRVPPPEEFNIRLRVSWKNP